MATYPSLLTKNFKTKGILLEPSRIFLMKFADSSLFRKFKENKRAELYLRTVYRICLYRALLGKNLFRFHETRLILHVKNSKASLFEIINLQTILTDAARISSLETKPGAIPLALDRVILDVGDQTLLSPSRIIYRPFPKNPTNRPRCSSKDPFS